MDVYSAEGVWWRPEASQHRVPGTLTSDEDGVELVVYGPLGPSIPSQGGVVKIDGSEWVATPVVHGRTRDGADITLLDVGGLMSLPVPFAAEVRETHTVSVACIGGHFSGGAFIEAQDGRPRWPLRALRARRSSAALSGSSPASPAGRDLPPSISIGGPRLPSISTSRSLGGRFWTGGFGRSMTCSRSRLVDLCGSRSFAYGRPTRAHVHHCAMLDSGWSRPGG
jgi:hypothetical protein